MPQPAPPSKERRFIWPLLINLSLLVLAVAKDDGDSTIFFSIVGLIIINGIAALIIYFSKGAMHFVRAFLLSCLLIALIGLGICGVMLSNWHGGGN